MMIQRGSESSVTIDNTLKCSGKSVHFDNENKIPILY